MFEILISVGVTVVGNIIGDVIAYYIIKKFF